MVVQRLGASAEYVWWLTYNQRRAVRNTMDMCDAYFALPANADYKMRGLDKTRAFLDVGYAVVAPSSFKFSGLEDLKGKRIGVLHGSTPHIVLSNETGYDCRNFREQDAVLAALDKGEIDVAVLWGPSAGYANLKQYAERWKVTPVAGQGLNGQVAVAVSKKNPELKAKIDQALTELQPEIKKLQQKYAFPQTAPVVLDAKGSWNAITDQVAGGSTLARATQAAHKDAAGMMAAGGAKADWRANMIKVNDVNLEDVKAMFNSRCSHCHGQNGASPQQERDLRKLSKRYDDKWREVAVTTITNGRTDLGMPNWGGTLSDGDIQNIVKFLETIQRK
jgi:mono/diheme cytochrome c family protein